VSASVGENLDPSLSLILGDDVETRVFWYAPLTQKYGQAIDPRIDFVRVAKQHVDTPTGLPAAPSRDFPDPFEQGVQLILEVRTRLAFYEPAEVKPPLTEKPPE
jgi:hypothetical protein